MKESPILAARGIPTSYPPSSPWHHSTPAQVRDFFAAFTGPWPKQFDQSLAGVIRYPGDSDRELTCEVCGEVADLIWFRGETCLICHRKAIYLGNLMTSGLTPEMYDGKGLWVRAMGYK